MSVAVAARGKDLVVSGGLDNSIRVHDLLLRTADRRVGNHQVGQGVAVAARGGKDIVVSGGDDKSIRVHDLASGQQIAVLEGHQGSVWSVAVASRGGKNLVVSGGDDKSIRVHDLASGQQIAVLEGHQSSVESVAVAARGGKDLVVSGGYDGSIRVHDLASGQQIAVLEGHSVRSVAVASRGGKDVVVSGGGSGTLQISTLRPNSFELAGKTYVLPRTGSVVRVRPDTSRGEVVEYASPAAWRDWSAQYRVDGGVFVTDLDDMPRAAGAKAQQAVTSS
jgi:WD40 repeat protein